MQALMAHRRGPCDSLSLGVAKHFVGDLSENFPASNPPSIFASSSYSATFWHCPGMSWL